MRLRSAVMAILMVVSFLAPMSALNAAAAPPAPSGLTIPITGTGTAGNLAGNLTITSFQVVNGALVAVGTLTGTLTNPTTGAVTSIVQTLTFPVTNIVGGNQATCQILHLELGPIDLNLLGLVVTTNRIVLDISAQPGPGNLLGNLLCAVANLLNSNGALTSIAQLLNQILGQL